MLRPDKHMYMFLLLVSSQDLNINVLYCVKILSSPSLCQITDYKFIKEMFSQCKFLSRKTKQKNTQFIVLYILLYLVWCLQKIKNYEENEYIIFFCPYLCKSKDVEVHLWLWWGEQPEFRMLTWLCVLHFKQKESLTCLNVILKL